MEASEMLFDSKAIVQTETLKMHSNERNACKAMLQQCADQRFVLCWNGFERLKMKS